MYTIDDLNNLKQRIETAEEIGDYQTAMELTRELIVITQEMKIQ